MRQYFVQKQFARQTGTGMQVVEFKDVSEGFSLRVEAARDMASRKSQERDARFRIRSTR